jgi:hypothetical protein
MLADGVKAAKEQQHAINVARRASFAFTSASFVSFEGSE